MGHYSTLISSFIQTVPVSPYLLARFHSTFAHPALLPLSHLSTAPLQQILSLHFFSSSDLLLNLVPSIRSALTLFVLCWHKPSFPPSLRCVWTAASESSHFSFEEQLVQWYQVWWSEAVRCGQETGVGQRQGGGAERDRGRVHSKLQRYQAKALGNTAINNVWRWVLFAGCMYPTDEMTLGPALLPCWQLGPIWPGGQVHLPVRGSHWPLPHAQNRVQSLPYRCSGQAEGNTAFC